MSADIIEPKRKKQTPTSSEISDNNCTTSKPDLKSKLDTKSSSSSRLHLITDKRDSPIGFWHYLAVFLWLGWIGSYFILFIAGIYFFFFHQEAFWTFASIVIVATIVPIKRGSWYSQPKWSLTLGLWIMQRAEEYFGLRLYFEDKREVEANSQAIFFLEPHDVLPISIFAFQDMLGYFSNHKMLGGLSGSMFKAPFMRHTMTWANAVSVDKSNLKRCLNKGHSLVVCPGGAQEAMYLQNKKEYTLFIKNRVGLVKLAMEYGIPIFPTFTFGLRETYPVWAPKNTFVRRWGSILGYVPMFFLGIFNIPFAQPKSTPLTVVVGKAIYVDKVSDPSVLNKRAEDMDPEVAGKMKRIHEQVVASIERIFYDYKHQFDMEDYKLSII